MVVFIGAIKVNSVASGSNVQIGDAGFIYLNSISKVHGGPGSFSPGDSFGSNSNQLGNTNTLDSDLVDTPNVVI